MNHRKQIIAAVAVTAIVSSTMGAVANAQLGSILKGGAIAIAIDKFGPQINSALNKLISTKGMQRNEVTKVVPILSAGNGGYAGAAQVVGPKVAVDKVKAVAQLEGEFNVIGGVRLRALIPIQAKSISNMHSVPGVGVSGLIDFKL